MNRSELAEKLRRTLAIIDFCGEHDGIKSEEVAELQETVILGFFALIEKGEGK